MYLEERTVFPPCLAGALHERILYRKEQFRRFVVRVIGPIDTQQDYEKQEGTDAEPHCGWRSADGLKKQAKILPPPMSEARHRPQWMRTAGARRTATAAR